MLVVEVGESDTAQEGTRGRRGRRGRQGLLASSKLTVFRYKGSRGSDSLSVARVGVPRYLATSWEFCPPLASLGLLPQLIMAFMKLGEPELRRGSAEPSSSFLPGKSMWVL